MGDNPVYRLCPEREGVAGGTATSCYRWMTCQLSPHSPAANRLKPQMKMRKSSDPSKSAERARSWDSSYSEGGEDVSYYWLWIPVETCVFTYPPIHWSTRISGSPRCGFCWNPPMVLYWPVLLSPTLSSFQAPVNPHQSHIQSWTTETDLSIYTHSISISNCPYFIVLFL